jgi:HSP20 family protein
MAEQGMKKQRIENEPTNLTPSERTEGLARRGAESLQRGGYFPSIFSVTPGEFFMMNPISLMRRFTEDIDRAFFGTRANIGRQSGPTTTWMPSVDVRQDGNNLVVSADLPGLSENDVRVEATADGLVIEGERKQEQSGEQGNWRHSERVYGRFYRLVPLPDGANVEQATANFNNGVLEVRVPVPEAQSHRRQIPIGKGQSPGSLEPGHARAAGR